MNDLTMEEKISAKTDLTVARSMEVSEAFGGLTFKDMGQVLEFSKLMAVSQQAVPKHLRGQPGMCMAVTIQALGWRMDPFAVANKSYAVNDRLAYEAQLIQAVIEQRAPIKGRIKGRYEGEGAKRQCVLTVVSSEDGETIEYWSPQIGMIKTKNSPLWSADPDQQLWYYSARAMCRRHFPDVLLGIYEREEIENAAPLRDVTPAPDLAQRPNLAQRLQRPVEPEPAQEAEQATEPHWTASVSTDGAFPGSAAWDAGVEAQQEGKAETDCPYDGDAELATDWLAGFRSTKETAQ